MVAVRSASQTKLETPGSSSQVSVRHDRDEEPQMLSNRLWFSSLSNAPRLPCSDVSTRWCSRQALKGGVSVRFCTVNIGMVTYVAAPGATTAAEAVAGVQGEPHRDPDPAGRARSKMG